MFVHELSDKSSDHKPILVYSPHEDASRSPTTMIDIKSPNQFTKINEQNITSLQGDSTGASPTRLDTHNHLKPTCEEYHHSNRMPSF